MACLTHASDRAMVRPVSSKRPLPLKFVQPRPLLGRVGARTRAAQRGLNRLVGRTVTKCKRAWLAIPQFPFKRAELSIGATTKRIEDASVMRERASPRPTPRAAMNVLYWRTVCVVLAIRPLACVFSAVELVLLVLLTLSYERWRWMIGNAAPEAVEELGHHAPNDDILQTKRAETTKKTTTTSNPIRRDLIGGGLASTAGMELTFLPSRGAKVLDESCCCAITDDESVDSCSTSDTCDMSLLSTPLEHRDKCERMSDQGFSDIHFSSMAMSRCSSEVVHNVEFMHKSGELQIRGDTMLNVFKPWRKCNILLSVMTGELFVHRKAKTPPQVFPLSRFTGASIHSKRRHSFKVMFDGHPPLYFRATKAHDAEHWVKALEYAKETTWRLWS